MEYSPFMRDMEGPAGTDLIATCRELGVACVAYAPLGRGLLTEKFSANGMDQDKKDLRAAFFPRFMEKNREANVQLVRRFKTLADKKGCSTSQLSLAWLLKQGDHVIPIPGTRKMKYLEDNWAVFNIELTDEEETEIRRLVEEADMVGDRNPPMVHEVGLVDTKEESE